MAKKKKAKKISIEDVQEGDWIRVELKPKTHVMCVVEIDGESFYGDVDGNSIKTLDINLGNIKYVELLEDPVELEVGGQSVRVLDGDVFVDDEPVDKKELLALFRALGPVLGYDVD